MNQGFGRVLPPALTYKIMRLRNTAHLADALSLASKQSSRPLSKTILHDERAQLGAQSRAQSEKIPNALSDVPLPTAGPMISLSMETRPEALKRTVPNKPTSRLQKYRRVKK